MLPFSKISKRNDSRYLTELEGIYLDRKREIYQRYRMLKAKKCVKFFTLRMICKI